MASASASSRGSGGYRPRSFRRLRPILLGTVVLATCFEGFAVSSSRLWVAPDSSEHITLAAEILEHGNISHELSQRRPPGYPLFLAAMFAVFKTNSAAAIHVVQHGMVVGCAVLSVLMAWTLWPHRGFAAMVGLVSGASLHLSGYANAVLTEVPYALLLTLSMLLVLRHWTTHGLGSLAAGSLAIGLAILMKPTGQAIPGLVLMVSLAGWWKTRRLVDDASGGSSRETEAPRRGHPGVVARVVCSLGPAAAVLVPVALHQYDTFGYFQVTAMGHVAPFYRAVHVEHLGVADSEALTRVEQWVTDARRAGAIPWEAGDQSVHTVLKACTATRGFTVSECYRIMGRAGWDILRGHPGRILRGSAVTAYRMFVMPDRAYRIVPGGAPGEAGRFARQAVMLSPDTYTPHVVDRVGSARMNRYMRVSGRAGGASDLWTGFARWYHATMERGRPMLGVADSPYEAFALMSVLGFGAGMVFGRHRAGWMILAAVVAYHVGVSSLIGSLEPRFVIPLHPVLHVAQGFFLVGVARWARRVVGMIGVRWPGKAGAGVGAGRESWVVSC
ncbi:MAG: hypothetical protein ACE5E6_11190, partial [Phycisphaerae bacterium]